MRQSPLVCLMLCGGLVLSACHSREKAALPPVPVGAETEAWVPAIGDKVKVVPVDMHELHANIVTTGRVTYDDSRVSHVFSPVTGRVVHIHAQPGDRVAQGAPLATIVSADIGVASSDVDKAQAVLTAAQADFNRKKNLFGAGAVAQRDLEAAADNYEIAAAELHRAQAKSRLLGARSSDANVVTDRYTLVSPIGGEVVSRFVNPGMEIAGQYQGGSGTELFTVADLDVVWVVADIYEVDVSRVQPGLGVFAHVESYPNKQFSGTVDWLSDVLDPITRSAPMRCVIQNPNGLLKPDMFATVTVASHGNKVLTVPRASIVHLGEKTMVFVQTGKNDAGDRRFVRRPVIVDEAEDGDQLPVMHGLGVGDVVVTEGVEALASDM